jgi:hypothetical protein
VHAAVRCRFSNLMYADVRRRIQEYYQRRCQKPQTATPARIYRLVLSTLPWLLAKCNNAMAHCDQKWNVSGFRNLPKGKSLIRSLKGWWQTLGNCLLTLVHSTLHSTKVGALTHARCSFFDCLLRNNGRDDDGERRRLGTVMSTTFEVRALAQTSRLGPTRPCDTRLQRGSRRRIAVSLDTVYRRIGVHDTNVSVLRPAGLFLYLTFGQPHFRKRYLSKPHTQLEVRQLGEAFHYYFYILRRQ